MTCAGTDGNGMLFSKAMLVVVGFSFFSPGFVSSHPANAVLNEQESCAVAAQMDRASRCAE